MPSQEDEIRALQKARSESKGTALGAAASSEFDRDLYGGAKGLSREIVDEPSQDDGETGGLHPSTQRDLRGPADDDDGEDPFKAHRDRNPANIPIAERESAYQAKGRATRELSPERQDPFADATPARGFREAMGSNVVDRERDDLLKKIAEKDDDDKQGKKRRFDDAGDKPAKEGKFDGTPGRFDATPGRFDATPGRFDATPGRFDATPGRFDATPGRFDAFQGFEKPRSPLYMREWVEGWRGIDSDKAAAPLPGERVFVDVSGDDSDSDDSDDSDAVKRNDFGVSFWDYPTIEASWA